MSFTDIILFGELNSIIKDKSTLHCTLTNMLLENTLDFDGTINIITNLKKIKKRDLWAYIYYICKHNPSIGINITPDDFKTKIANGKSYIKKGTLVNFINITIHNNNIKIDFINNLMKIVYKKLNIQEEMIDKAIADVPEIRELEDKLKKINRLISVPRSF